jgi:probable phosphoglycerate mutase
MNREPARFGLIRHAPTLWNREKRIQGTDDSPLTDDGRHLAENWGWRLAKSSFDRILASDLGRACQTAEKVNIALGVPISTTPGLREMDWGRWTGRTLKQIKTETRDRLSAMERMGWAFQPPGGERRGAVLERARQALSEAADTWPGQTILVITHEGVIKALIYGAYHRLYLPTEPRILKPGHLHWLKGRAGGISPTMLNAMDLNATIP